MAWGSSGCPDNSRPARLGVGGGEVVPCQGSRSEGAFPSSQKCCPERPGAVKGAPLLGTAKRTLDGEDRSERIAEEGKAGRKIGEKWSAILVPWPAASDIACRNCGVAIEEVPWSDGNHADQNGPPHAHQHCDQQPDRRCHK